MSNEDGGPAFRWNGMALRDWFAGQALTGLASRIGEKREDDLYEGIEGGGGDGSSEAVVAYRLADAMLAARGGGA